MDIDSAHLEVVELLRGFSDDDFLRLFVVVAGTVGIDEDSLEVVEDLSLVAAFFLLEASGQDPGQREHARVLVLPLEVGLGAAEILQHEEGPQNHILAVQQILVADIVPEL